MRRTTKLAKIRSYLFEEFPFNPKPLNYEDYWRRITEEGLFEASRYKQALIANMIEKGSSVLDIGCGDGSLLSYLIANKNVHGFGVDISEHALQKALSKGLRVRRFDISKEEFAREDSYDYVIMSEVLEHLPNAEHVMLKVRGMFTKSLLVDIPNIGFIGERLRLLFGRFPKQWAISPAEHLRFWTIRDFTFWSSQLGLKVVKYYGLEDEYSGLTLGTWKKFPGLFSRYVLYELKRLT